jgi:ABC-type nickel/cobalt efflux system permease component RcnA
MEQSSRGDQVSARQLLVLGLTGGMVPCPAALVVLLSAVALHRTGFGLFLIVAFSIGLAVVLIAMGFVAVYAGRIMSRLPFEAPLVQRWLPMASALMISVLGCGIAARGLLAAGIVHIRL